MFIFVEDKKREKFERDNYGCPDKLIFWKDHNSLHWYIWTVWITVVNPLEPTMDQEDWLDENLV